MIGFLLAALMGVVLGLLGGGGSILTVPILVYFFNISATLATAYSLFVVGITSLIGAIQYRHQLNVMIGILFAVPSTIGVILSRRYILQELPNEIYIFNSLLTKDDLVMLVFAILIVVIAFFMLTAKDKYKGDSKSLSVKSITFVAIEGLVVGGVTGFVGAGGGFMIVPALTLLVGIPIKEAIATSLLIIAVKSLIGFLADLQMDVAIDWSFLLLFSTITIIGGICGGLISRKVSAQKLRRLFAYFVLVVGLIILLV